MANTEIINLVIQTTADMLHYMMPIIALLAGLNFVLSFFYQVTFGAIKRIN